MLLIRFIATLLVLSFLLNMAVYTVTRQPRFRVWAMVSLKWGVVLALCFVGYLVLRRAAMFV